MAAKGRNDPRGNEKEGENLSQHFTKLNQEKTTKVRHRLSLEHVIEIWDEVREQKQELNQYLIRRGDKGRWQLFKLWDAFGWLAEGAKVGFSVVAGVFVAFASRVQGLDLPPLSQIVFGAGLALLFLLITVGWTVYRLLLRQSKVGEDC